MGAGNDVGVGTTGVGVMVGEGVGMSADASAGLEDIPIANTENPGDSAKKLS